MGEPALADVPTARLGNYEILRRITVTATSEIFLARGEGRVGPSRTVVLKKLLPSLTMELRAGARIEAEAHAYARLTHDAIVQLFEVIRDGDAAVLVLEHVDGITLEELLARLQATGRHLDGAAALYIGFRVFAALASAHAAKDPRSGEPSPVIHRDVRPQNVFLPWDGKAKLASFGLAKVVGVTSDTNTGSLKGTYGYMAPEQVLGEAVAPATDVYLGSLMLRELLARKPTFPDLPELALLQAMADAAFPPLEDVRPNVPKALAASLRTALARVAADRKITASEMMDVLQAEVLLERGRASLSELLASVRDGAGVSGARPSKPAAEPLFDAAKAEQASDPKAAVSEILERALARERELQKLISREPLIAEADLPTSAAQDSANMILAAPVASPSSARRAQKDAAAAGKALEKAKAAAWAQIDRESDDPILPLARGPFHVRRSLLIPILILGGIAAAALVIVALLPRTARRATPPVLAAPAKLLAPIAAPMETSDGPVEPTPEASATAEAPAASAASAAQKPVYKHGVLTLPPAAKSHRVYVDGVVVGEGEGPFDVACGQRQVRIGSHGDDRAMTIECTK